MKIKLLSLILSAVVGVNASYAMDDSQKPENCDRGFFVKFVQVGGQLTVVPSDEVVVSQASTARFILFDETYNAGKLSSLTARGTGFTVPLTSISDEFRIFQKLYHLDFSGNQLTSFPDVILKLTNLEVLHLNNNQIAFVPSNICKLKKLQSLCLSNNMLTSFSDVILKLTNLEFLDLNDNQIAFVPSNICKLKKLRSLGLSNNMLTSLPPSIGNLDSLNFLRTSKNRLTGYEEDLVDSSIQITKDFYREVDRQQSETKEAAFSAYCLIRKIGPLFSIPKEIQHIIIQNYAVLWENKYSLLRHYNKGTKDPQKSLEDMITENKTKFL